MFLGLRRKPGEFFVKGAIFFTRLSWAELRADQTGVNRTRVWEEVKEGNIWRAIGTQLQLENFYALWGCMSFFRYPMGDARMSVASSLV